MTFLLDANVLIDFQSAGVLPRLMKAADAIDLAVVEKVHDEVALPRPDDSQATRIKKSLAAAALQGSRIKKLEILPGTREAGLMQALLRPLAQVKDKDQGEMASIAVAASDASLVFVTGDRNGILWALNELYASGERVMRVPVFVRTLQERGAIDAAAVKTVAPFASNHGTVPSWWNAWVAAL